MKQEILVTAFEPFEGRKRNASAEVLRLLPDAIGAYRIRKMLLPVVFGRAAELVLQQPAEAVFLLGEAGNRSTVTPEIRAVNLRDARIPDNSGYKPERGEIVPGGPAEYRTDVPVSRIVERMKEEGCPIEVSEDAGTFVCNDTFYCVGTKRSGPVAFIHCPGDADKAADYAKTIRRFIEIAMEQSSPSYSNIIKNSLNRIHNVDQVVIGNGVDP